MQLARLTIDLLRPVPVAPLSIETEILREGRKIQLSAVRLMAVDTEVARATASRVRIDHLLAPRCVGQVPLDRPGPEQASAPTEIGDLSCPFHAGISMRVASGNFRKAGPAAVIDTVRL